MSGDQNSLKLVLRCHQHLSWFLAHGQVPRESYQMRLSADVKGDIVMRSEAVHRSPSINLTAEENLENPYLGDRR